MRELSNILTENSKNYYQSTIQNIGKKLSKISAESYPKKIQENYPKCVQRTIQNIDNELYKTIVEYYEKY